MQFTQIITLIAAAAVAGTAAAYPGGSSEPSSGSATNNGNICPHGQAQSCCKDPAAGVLGNLLGGSCELNVLGQNCPQTAACCNIHQDGSLVVDGSCAPLLNL